MRHTVDYEILSHDTGHNGEVHPSAVFRYFQETADHQMRTEGPTYRELYEQGLAFVLSRMHVRLHATLRSYDKVTVQTWAYDPPRGAAFERYYQLYRGDELVADAASVWALLGIKTGELCRVDATNVHYGSDEPLDIGTRFRLPSLEWIAADAHTVRYADVDINNHMNNTRYPDMLCDRIPDIDARRITDLQIAYLSEAPLGETLAVKRAVTEEDGHTVYWFETERQDGKCNVRARIETERI